MNAHWHKSHQSKRGDAGSDDSVIDVVGSRGTGEGDGANAAASSAAAPPPAAAVAASSNAKSSPIDVAAATAASDTAASDDAVDPPEPEPEQPEPEADPEAAELKARTMELIQDFPRLVRDFDRFIECTRIMAARYNKR
jgi:hypothetical protein